MTALSRTHMEKRSKPVSSMLNEGAYENSTQLSMKKKLKSPKKSLF